MSCFTDKILVIIPEYGNADGQDSLGTVGQDTRTGSIDIGYKKVRYKIIR